MVVKYECSEILWNYTFNVTYDTLTHVQVNYCLCLVSKGLSVCVHNPAVNNLLFYCVVGQLWSWCSRLTGFTLMSFVTFLVFQRLLKIPMEKMTVKVLSPCSPRSNEAMPRMSLCGLRPVGCRYCADCLLWGHCICKAVSGEMRERAKMRSFKWRHV